MDVALTLVAGTLLIAVIIAANGYFVAQEFGYMAVDRSRLKARAAEGDTGASRALDITRRTSFMLSGAQLGITVTGLLVGYVAEPLIGNGIGELLGLVDVEDRHAVDRRRGRGAGGGVDHVVGADDQHHVGVLELAVDLVHLDQLLVGHLRLGEQHVHVAGHAPRNGVNRVLDGNAAAF